MDDDAVAEVMAKPISTELLGSSIPARLAYIGIDGDPRVIPIGFLWDGAQLTVCTVPKSAKVPALRQNPRVALTIDTDSQPPHVLLIRGEATVVVVDGVPDVYIEASRKLVPADSSTPGRPGFERSTSRWPRSRSSPTGRSCLTSRPRSRRRSKTWSRPTAIRGKWPWPASTRAQTVTVVLARQRIVGGHGTPSRDHDSMVMGAGSLSVRLTDRPPGDPSTENDRSGAEVESAVIRPQRWRPEGRSTRPVPSVCRPLIGASTCRRPARDRFARRLRWRGPGPTCARRTQ